MSTEIFWAMNEEGVLIAPTGPIDDVSLGRSLLAHLQRDDRGRFSTSFENTPVRLEVFDEPLVVHAVRPVKDLTWELTAQYGFTARFSLSDLRADPWDRFHGRTETGIPFVLNRSAQNEFFNAVDEFDDDSVTFNGQQVPVGPWLDSKDDVNREGFWSHIYRTETPGWELEAPAAALKSVLPQLKIPRCRILVPGCGSGNDAAFFAEQGHIVTGMDMSPEAIERAKSKYGHLPNLQFVQGDVFHPPKDFTHAFDLVFEHTLYCAITPERRPELVKMWRHYLAEHGHLLGVFFTMDKPSGPPFGGSEWEIRQRLGKTFEPLYWTRWRHSIDKRQNIELVVYARLV